MAILTLAQMISRATTLAGGRLDWNASDASFYVNQAAGYVARNAALEHRSLESSYATAIGSGVSRMVLPTDYDYPISLSVDSQMASGSTRWRTMVKRDIGWADIYAGRVDATAGPPEAYVEFGERFEIVPPPNSVHTLLLRYRSQVSEVVTSTNTFNLAEQWNWAVVLKAAELLAMSRSDFELEQIARNRYIDYMSTVLPDQDKKWMDVRGSLSPFPASRSAQTARL